jgi:hypothetical protein
VASPTPATGPDRVLLWGIPGLALAVCCAPLGVVFGVQSALEARKTGRSPVLGYTAAGLGVLLTIINLIAIAAGAYSGITVR